MCFETPPWNLYIWHSIGLTMKVAREELRYRPERAWTHHDDVIKWKHFPRNWPFVRGIHRSPVNSPHKGQWRGALMFSLICARINGWVNTREAGDLRRYRPHYDVIVMWLLKTPLVEGLGKHYLESIIFSLTNLEQFWMSISVSVSNSRPYSHQSNRINAFQMNCWDAV